MSDGYQELHPPLYDAYVYRTWAGDRCLYVGSTRNLWGRIGNHRNAPWWPLVTRVDVKGYPNILDAEWEEFEQAAQLRPAHCTRWGKFRPDTPRDYAYQMAHSRTPEQIRERWADANRTRVAP